MRGDVRDRLATTEAPFIRRSKYCESTPRSQVNLSHDSSRARRAVGRACELPLGSAKEAPFIRSVQILRTYDAPSLLRKDNRFDQELPSIRGSKVWRKGSRPVAWLDGMVEILVSAFQTGNSPPSGHFLGPVQALFDETALRLTPSFPLGNGL